MEKNKFLAYPEGQVSGSELDGQDSEPGKYFWIFSQSSNFFCDVVEGMVL